MPPPPPPTGAPAIRDRALDERERLEILRRFDLLDTAPEEDLDDLTSIAAAICGTPISLITLIDADRQWFKSRVGVEHTESPRETAFCARAIAQDDDLFVVPDAAADPRFASNPDVTGGLHVRFYAGAPLVTQEGAALGTLCVIDREPRELTAGQERALRALSRAVVAQFELRRQNERLRALDRLKDEFVAVIAHDLRTPLTAIRGYVDVLLDGGGGEITETQARFLGIVGRNADKLTRLSADLLFLARAEAGTLDLETGDVDLAELVGDAAATAGPSGRDRGVEIDVEIEEVVLVHGDRARLAQLLDNLVSNAVKFTPAGGRVTLALRARDGAAVVEVADTGVGIPADEVPLLFTRFFRASAARQGGVPGTGLGLTIARTIAEAHGGTIAVESREGEGTRFTISLPFAR
jgi:signal transduction histidine kinase